MWTLAAQREKPASVIIRDLIEDAYQEVLREINKETMEQEISYGEV